MCNIEKNYSRFFLVFLIFTLILENVELTVYSRKYTQCNDFKLENGRMRIKPRGKLARFQCNRGFLLAGEKYSYCIKGKFDVPPPVCVKPTCFKIKSLTNGLILPSYNGAVANFFCKPGFILRGANISYCDGNRWSNNLPACISTHTPTQLSCDFETEDLCGWSHDLNHDFDWRRQNFQTPSGHIGTGPRYDHTKGINQDGYYVYIESTSRLENNTARLISPIYDKMPNGLCFTFYYHMYGSGIGQLKVYIKKESEFFDGLKPSFVESGNQGDVWKKGSIVLEDGINEDFQIILEGIRGKSYISDIAVDDVNLAEFCSTDDDDFNSTTTELVTEEYDYSYYGSCVNHCNETSEIIFGNSGSCECNDDCHEKNTCCPDYIYVCYIAQFETESTTVEDVITETVTIFEPLNTITPITNTTLNETKQKNIETIVSTTTQETISIVNSIVPIEINKQMNETRTTIDKNETETTKTTLTTTETTKTTLTTTPTTKTTFKVKLPQKNVTKTTVNINEINKISNKEKKLTKKPILQITTLAKIPKTTASILTRKIIEKTTEEGIIIVTIDATTEKQTLAIETDYKPIFISEKVLNNPIKTNKLNITTIVSASIFFVVVFVLLAIVFAWKKLKFSRLSYRSSRHGESMSDVRFLTSDEVLDFTWRSADS